MANLSMRDIDDTHGINRNFVTKLESGKIKALNLETIRSLEAAFRQENIELTREADAWGAGVRWTVPDPFKR